MVSSRNQHGVMYLFIAQLTFMLSGYITNIWLGRHLGPADYGIYGTLTSLLTVLNIIQVSGMPQTVSKFTAENESDADSILKSALRIQMYMTIGLGLIFFALSPLFAAIFHDSKFLGYTRAMALIFPLYGLYALYGGYYNGLHRFKRQALMTVMYSLAKLVLVIGLATVFSLYGVIVGFVLAPFFALLFGFHWPRSKVYFPPKKLIVYSIPLIGYAVFSALQLTIDLFAVKALVANNASAGFYAASQNIALVTFLSMSALGQVLFPRISRLVANDQHEQARVVIGSSLRNLLLILLPLTALIAGTAPLLVRLLFGNAYAPTVPILRILVVSYFFITIFAMFANILSGAGRVKSTTFLAATGLVVGLASCILLIPIFGAVGAAMATGIGGIVVALGSMRVTYKQFKYTFYWPSIIKITSGALIVLLLGWVVSLPALLLPLWWLVLGVIYLGWLVITREVTYNDWLQARDLMPVWLSRKLPE